MEQLNRIGTTWHNVTARESKDIQNLDRIEKGSRVHVVGRIRNQRFCGTDGVERTMCEVIATKAFIIATLVEIASGLLNSADNIATPCRKPLLMLWGEVGVEHLRQSARAPEKIKNINHADMGCRAYSGHLCARWHQIGYIKHTQPCCRAVYGTLLCEMISRCSDEESASTWFLVT